MPEFAKFGLKTKKTFDYLLKSKDFSKDNGNLSKDITTFANNF